MGWFEGEWIDLRVRRLWDNMDYLMSLRPLADEYGIVECPPLCDECGYWGSPPDEDGYGCERCYSWDMESA